MTRNNFKNKEVMELQQLWRAMTKHQMSIWKTIFNQLRKSWNAAQPTRRNFKPSINYSITAPKSNGHAQ